jgi:hypothetical protein
MAYARRLFCLREMDKVEQPCTKPWPSSSRQRGDMHGRMAGFERNGKAIISLVAQTSALRWVRVVDSPELNIVLFAFLLSFPWEILQGPFFEGRTEMRHGEAVRTCTLASVGDVGLMLVNFWIVASAGGGRRWPLQPTVARVAGFTVLGLTGTILFEILATRVWHRWHYSALMPTVPLLEVGLTPLLWGLLPPLVVWVVCRQLRGGSGGVTAEDERRG